MAEMITISKELYDQLTRASEELNALHNAGVDNWEWYGDAISSLDEED